MAVLNDYFNNIFFKKIVVTVVGPVSMWITVFKQGNTVYQHVDRLCLNSCKLYTLFYLNF